MSLAQQVAAKLDAEQCSHITAILDEIGSGSGKFAGFSVPDVMMAFALFNAEEEEGMDPDDYLLAVDNQMDDDLTACRRLAAAVRKMVLS